MIRFISTSCLILIGRILQVPEVKPQIPDPNFIQEQAVTPLKVALIFGCSKKMGA